MSSSRRRRTAALLALAVAPAAALPVIAHASGARATRNATVTLKDIKFKPGSVTITRGGRVTWLWKDGDTSHNVTASGFKRSPTKQSGSYSVRFTKKGTFRYRCTIHSGMNGKVIVR